jgi:hypothetical protein
MESEETLNSLYIQTPLYMQDEAKYTVNKGRPT